MASRCWHAYYYDGPYKGRAPVMSNWIEAGSADEAIEIARRQLGTLKRVELEAPRWEERSPPLFVTPMRH